MRRDLRHREGGYSHRLRQGEKELVRTVSVDAWSLELVECDHLPDRLVGDALGRLASFSQGEKQRRHRASVESQRQHRTGTAGPGLLADVDAQPQLF